MSANTLVVDRLKLIELLTEQITKIETKFDELLAELGTERAAAQEAIERRWERWYRTVADAIRDGEIHYVAENGRWVKKPAPGHPIPLNPNDQNMDVSVVERKIMRVTDGKKAAVGNLVTAVTLLEITATETVEIETSSYETMLRSAETTIPRNYL